MSTVAFTEAAIVLLTRTLGEGDILANLLTKSKGKIRGVARNARQSKKRFAGGIDLFDLAEFEIKPPRRSEGLYALNSIGKRQSSIALRENLAVFVTASFLVEIADSFAVEEDPEGSELFLPLYHCLQALSKNTEQANFRWSIAAYFLSYALSQGGFGYLAAATGNNQEVERWIQEMLERRGPIAPHDDQLTVGGLKELIAYAESVLGHPFRSTGELFQR